ncbi:MAG: alanine racemase, partial [Acidobacteria bacterium]|nr:alanine racemase [Acidobacteriota bacterium]
MGPPHRSFVEISRERIARNYREVKRAVGPGVEVLGVVKADAYGHGAREVAGILIAEGARWLGVSSVEEGVALRSAGIGARILILAGFLPYERAALVEHRLTPVIHSLEDLAALEELAAAARAPVSFHLKVDTGMGRLGTRAPADRIAAVLAASRQVRFEGLMSHFASAADYSSAQTDAQIAAFTALQEALVTAGVRPEYVHLASTNAIGYGRREAWGNLVRAGHALYGYLSPARGPAPEPLLRLEPALNWKARILAVKEIDAGALVGYGGSFRAPRPMRIAILGAGYADGIFHRLSNRGQVIAAGKLAPILGTVSMDLATIDISHSSCLAPGDTVTLLGSEGEASLDA